VPVTCRTGTVVVGGDVAGVVVAVVVGAVVAVEFAGATVVAADEADGVDFFEEFDAAAMMMMTAMTAVTHQRFFRNHGRTAFAVLASALALDAS